MIYIDTSSFLKLLFRESESDAVRHAVAVEREVLVSSLTELEARTQLKAAWLGGDCTKARYRAMLLGLDALREVEPFRFVGLSGRIFDAALQQDQQKEMPHLRTLDRLHLAAMDELRAQRLLTNDGKLASAARALGLEVIEPTDAA